MTETNDLTHGDHAEQGRPQVPARNRRRLLLLVPFGLAAAITVGHVGSRPDSSPSATVGDCFRPVNGDAVTEQKASCRSSTADIRVTAVVSSLTAGGGEQCPEDTDAVLNGNELGDVASIVCAVGLRAPHPGAPGLGGGILRTGDCVADPGAVGTTLEEQPCGRPGQLTVLGRVAADAACPAAATTARAAGSFGVTHPKICLVPVAPAAPRLRADLGGDTGSDGIASATKPGGDG